ncbi:MAG: rhodanese-like domain-containing protein [Cyclobacteriaceae bacterium]
MKIEQLYTGCLAQGAYYIVSGNEAAIVDPLREIKPYLDRAERDGVTIKYVLETHFHADFVSGHVDLARATGARIIFGPTAKPSFEAHVARDGEELKLGTETIRVLHTPGHTMESCCFLAVDETGVEKALFSGDTLFIGDVGRPDLAQRPGLTLEDLAGYLFDSLQQKVLTLPDDVVVYPAHGAGSLCGKKMSSETTDTIGHQRTTNYALKIGDKRDFITAVTSGLTTPPAYFPLNVRLNKEGYESFSEILHRSLRPLSPASFETAAEELHALILDTRDPEEFVQGFVPMAVNIGLNGAFAPWAGALIPGINTPILLITKPGKEEEAVTRLSRVGFDNVVGYLEGGFASWIRAGQPVDTIATVTPEQLHDVWEDYPFFEIIDVRRQTEFDAEHIVGSHNMPLDRVNDSHEHMDRKKTYYVTCAGGYRSVIFISILKSRGFESLINVQGGFAALKKSGKFSVSDYVEPVSLL